MMPRETMVFFPSRPTRCRHVLYAERCGDLDGAVRVVALPLLLLG